MPLVSKTFSQLITFTRASSATYFDAAGVLQTATTDVPRFDYDPSTLAARGFLIEESRTNLLTYSAEFDDASWIKSNAVITANAAVAPDGSLSADKLVGDAILAPKFMVKLGLSSTVGILSFYAKAAEETTVSGWLVTATVGALFDLSTGVATSAGSTAFGMDAVGNGWYRCWLYSNTATTTAHIYMRTGSQFTGNGVDGLFIWGAQFEAGAFPTSYIPTTTTAVTRAADVASVNTLSPWYNSTQGTIYAELMRPSLIPSGAFANAWSISDNTNNERFIAYNTGTGATMDVNVTDGGVNQATISAPGAIAANTIIKTAFAYAVNDFAWVRDAGTVQTDTSGTLPTVNRLYIGANSVGTGQWTGWIRRLTAYPRRLSNAELQSITT